MLKNKAEMNGSHATITLSANNLSAPNNGTEFLDKIYLFKPINPSTKLDLLVSLVAIGVIAFGGNVLILLFLKSKERANSFLGTCSFQMNFNLYIKSLAISDILCSVISLPYVGLQLYIDVLQRGWGCKVGKYLIGLFPCVTINNLMVISLGKYFSTRKVPRTFSHSTVKKIVFFAWSAGFLVAIFPASTFQGIRYDLNTTHYTVTCMYDEQHTPFRIIFFSVLFLQYIIPTCILIRINISLIITVWKRGRANIDVQRDNGIRLMVRAVRVRGIYTVIAITFAFVTPYLFYFANVIYHMVARPNIEFERDQVTRTMSVIIALSNSAINVVIYLVQMKDFRTFFKEKFIKVLFIHHQEIQVGVVGIEVQPQGNP